MDMRDKIASIVRRLLGGFGTEYELTDAILAALPDMIPDLVWVDLHGDGSLYQIDNDHPIQCHAVINRRGRLGWSYLEEMYDTLEDAKASANAHYKAQLARAMGWTA